LSTVHIVTKSLLATSTQPRPPDATNPHWPPVYWLTQQKSSGAHKIAGGIADSTETAPSTIICFYIDSSSNLISAPKDIWASGTSYAVSRLLGALITWQLGLLSEIYELGNSQVDGRIGNGECIPLQKEPDCSSQPYFQLHVSIASFMPWITTHLNLDSVFIDVIDKREQILHRFQDELYWQQEKMGVIVIVLTNRPTRLHSAFMFYSLAVNLHKILSIT
jgi:hypothetical protein